jgi:hypothetical protein
MDQKKVEKVEIEKSHEVYSESQRQNEQEKRVSKKHTSPNTLIEKLRDAGRDIKEADAAGSS